MLITNATDFSPIEYDVCIIGSGPAGMALAGELDGLPLRVILLESGQSRSTARSDALTQLEQSVGDFDTPNQTRSRRIGGTSSMWNVRLEKFHTGARYLPLDSIDFEHRPDIPNSGWPFGRSELARFYERANELCGAGPARYDVSDWAKPPESPDLASGHDSLRTIVETFGPGDQFTNRLAERLQKSRNVTLAPGTTVLRLKVDEGKPAVREALLLTGPRQRTATLRARVFVLACGAIDNARILLMSKSESGAALGNQSDLVGRFFMDHYRMSAGVLQVSSRSLFEQASLYDMRTVDRSTVCCKLAIAEDELRRQGILNSAVRLLPQPHARQLSAVRGLKVLGSDLRHRTFTKATVDNLRLVPSGASYLVGTGLQLAIRQRRFPPNVDAPGWSRLPNNRRRFVSFELEHQVEQAPDPANRVVLTDHLLADGTPMARIHNRWTELDLRSIGVTRGLLRSAVRESGLGEIVGPNDLLPIPTLATPAGAHHHMGTTRMNDNPRYGVVDAQLKVHGVTNLYVAGASVFPTGGFANPTLTIVALSIRLAEHVKTLFRFGV